MSGNSQTIGLSRVSQTTSFVGTFPLPFLPAMACLVVMKQIEAEACVVYVELRFTDTSLMSLALTFPLNLITRLIRGHLGHFLGPTSTLTLC